MACGEVDDEEGPVVLVDVGRHKDELVAAQGRELYLVLVRISLEKRECVGVEDDDWLRACLV